MPSNLDLDQGRGIPQMPQRDLQVFLAETPPWLFRAGPLLLLCIFVLFIWLAYWIRYPDRVEGPVLLSFNEPPIRSLAPKSGYIQNVDIKHNQTVEKGDILLTFQSAAQYADVLSMHNILEEVAFFNLDKVLNIRFNDQGRVGELSPLLTAFLQARQSYKDWLKGGSQETVVAGLQRQIKTLESGIQALNRLRSNLLVRMENLQIQMKNEEAMVRLDKLSQNELNATRDQWMALSTEANLAEAEGREKQFYLTEIRSEMNVLINGNKKGREAALDQVKQTFFALQSATAKWIYSNLLKASITGVIQVVNNNLKSGQYVYEDEPLFLIIPEQSNRMRGLMNVPLEKSGGVTMGQKVIVRLLNYPSEKYGVLTGSISSLTRIGVESEDGLVVPVRIRFSDPLITNVGYRIPSGKELAGTARIITKEKRLIQRLFE